MPGKRTSFFHSLVIIMAVMIAILCTYNASASPEMSNQQTIDENQSENATILRVNTVCNGLPHHYMRAHCWGNVTLRDGTAYIVLGALWQCQYCHLIMVTEGDMYLGQMSTIGKWALLPFPEPVTAQVTFINPPSAYGYTSSNYMNGYKFVK